VGTLLVLTASSLLDSDGGGTISKKEFLQIAQQSGPEIAKWGCGSVSPAWQSQTAGNCNSGCTTSIQRLDIETGEYELVFTTPPDRTNPPFRNINSCAINGQDDILYCSMQINNKGSFLVRIDTAQIGFVAKLPEWQFSGIFDAKGNYYCSGDKSWSVLTGVTAMPTYASLDSLAGNPKFTENYVSNIGADFGFFSEDLEGTGTPQDYIISAQDSVVTLIRVGPTPYVTTQLTPTGLPSGKTWASVWSFKSTIFMAAEDGSGIVQLEMTSIHINQKNMLVQIGWKIGCAGME